MTIRTQTPLTFLTGMASLLVCQLVGEVLVRYWVLPIPGPVVGMLLLLAMLFGYQRHHHAQPASLQITARALLAHLSLLFIPAGVGVMVHAERLIASWFPLLCALIIGAIVTLTVTAFTLRKLLHWVHYPLEPHDD